MVRIAIGLILAAVGLLNYSSAQATAESQTAAPDRSLAGDAACTRCHDESESKPILSMYKTRHGVKADTRTPGCQSCHGASEAHLKNKSTPPDVTFGKHAKATPQMQVETCMTCHQGGLRTLWAGSQHQSQNIPCAACHTVHTSDDPVMTKATQPDVCFQCHKGERAQIRRISTHPLAAGEMACTNCHNPHGSTGPKLLAKNSVNETCYTCHAEKRGPFLWEHGPVTDECTNCHTPHGSNNAPLLKTRVPYLCQECHSGDHGAQVNSGANLQAGNVTTVNGINPLANAAARAQLAARACLNCHVLIHGSNHPAGSKFQR
ncbi:MAG TPA: DmsE family decaheme c-type cytochrome [Steroidobacteraceae bacterium]|nr:DmsE family decaheme c-type cytochrome [Steroidobacteraceae bacterium]